MPLDHDRCAEECFQEEGKQWSCAFLLHFHSTLKYNHADIYFSEHFNLISVNPLWHYVGRNLISVLPLDGVLVHVRIAGSWGKVTANPMNCKQDFFFFFHLWHVVAKKLTFSQLSESNQMVIYITMQALVPVRDRPFLSLFFPLHFPLLCLGRPGNPGLILAQLAYPAIWGLDEWREVRCWKDASSFNWEQKNPSW